MFSCPQGARAGDENSLVAAFAHGHPIFVWLTASSRVVVGTLELVVVQSFDVPDAQLIACSRDTALLAIGAFCDIGWRAAAKFRFRLTVHSFVRSFVRLFVFSGSSRSFIVCTHVPRICM